MRKLSRKFFSYFLVGGVSALVEWLFFYLFNLFLGYEVSTALSFIVSTTANYFLGKHFTFKDNRHHKTDFTKVFIVSFIGLLLNMFNMYIFIGVWHFSNDLLCKIVSTGLVFIWNFLSRILFIYNDKKPKEEIL